MKRLLIAFTSLTLGSVFVDNKVAAEDACETTDGECFVYEGKRLKPYVPPSTGGAGGGFAGGNTGGGYGSGSGSSNSGNEDDEEDESAECVKNASLTFEYCSATADTDHYFRLSTGCQWVAGFPSGAPTSLCIEVSTAALNSENHICESVKINDIYECANP